MANAYGGEAKPRVRMIPKRYASKERSSVLRDSSILSPTQVHVSQRNSQMLLTQQRLDPTSPNAKSNQFHRHFDDIVSRESNQAVTVKNYHKKVQR